MNETSENTPTAKYLSFFLAAEEYGIDILQVQEIKSWTKVTILPNTPQYLCGVINLRGDIVPIIDLRLRFQLKYKEYTATTVIIVVKILSNNNKERIMGIIVDAVSDVHTIIEDEIKPTPDFGNKINTEFIKGLVTINDKIIIILDINHLLNSDELTTITDLADNTN
ncbi:MAG: chemotaxis protein CheW [Thiomargarita sp.]|nr:chemotaxis protein CheW [Thiomargarita sp.]